MLLLVLLLLLPLLLLLLLLLPAGPPPMPAQVAGSRPLPRRRWKRPPCPPCTTTLSYCRAARLVLISRHVYDVCR